MPDERLASALGELYAFYGRTEQMLENLTRDEHTVPIVGERFAAFRFYIGAVRDTLALGRRLRGAAKRRTVAALGHAIAFATWKSLTREQGLTDKQAVALMCALVAAAERPRRKA